MSELFVQENQLRRLISESIAEALRAFSATTLPAIMTTEEVAERWRFSTGKVLEIVSAGYLKNIPFNQRLFRYRREDVLNAEELLIEMGELERRPS